MQTCEFARHLPPVSLWAPTWATSALKPARGFAPQAHRQRLLTAVAFDREHKRVGFGGHDGTLGMQGALVFFLGDGRAIGCGAAVGGGYGFALHPHLLMRSPARDLFVLGDHDLQPYPDLPLAALSDPAPGPAPPM